MALLAATVTLVLLAMLAMAVGVLLTGRRLRGSCGGEGAVGPDGRPLDCGACPNRRAGGECSRRDT